MDIAPISAELVLVGASLLLLLSARIVRRGGMAALVTVVASAAAWMIPHGIYVGSGSRAAFGGMLALDGYSDFFRLLFCINLVLTAFVSLRALSREKTPFAEYFSLLLLATSGMTLIASALDLIVLYLGLELMSLSTYVLVGISRNNPKSNEAAIKYFLLGGFSTTFLLYGVAMIYGLTGTTSIAAVASRIADRGIAATPLLLVSVALFAVGFGFKIAAAPFHVWAPDAYEGAPTSITAFMSVGTKAAGFAALGRVFMYAFDGVKPEWAAMLVPLAVLSVVVGNVVAIAQTNIKRMLAYSSTAHAGYALLGVIAGTPEGLSSVMNYLFIYAFMTMGAFAIVILLRSEGVQGEDLRDYEGLASSHPVTSALMLLFMFSLTGIPPTAGFVAKFYVFLAAIRAGYTPLAVIAVIFSVVSAFFYLRVVMYMYMREPKKTVPITGSLPVGVALAVAALVILFLGVFPSYRVDSARMSLPGF